MQQDPRFPNLFITDHPLIQHKLSHMRERDTSTRTFRELLKEITLLMGYEITRDLPLTTREVETPLMTIQAPVIAGKKLAIVPILRAGIGMSDGLLNLVPSARVGHIGVFRDPETHQPVEYLVRLPDLAERIQVSLLNVLEERDIQIRGYRLRLPLDLLLVATANPEDYTNRGRIITPLKDRFGAEIRTHYPTELVDEVAIIRQESDLVADVPDHLVEILARFTRGLRESSAVDQRSGVSARFAIAFAVRRWRCICSGVGSMPGGAGRVGFKGR